MTGVRDYSTGVSSNRRLASHDQASYDMDHVDEL
jgi:hypothetical protein